MHVAGVSAQLEPACRAFRLGEGRKTPKSLLPHPVGQRGTVGDSWQDLHGHPDRSGGDTKVPAMAPGAVPCLPGTEAVAAHGSQNTPSPPGPQLAVKIT